MAKGKKSSLSRARISSIKAASNAILTLNGSNITLMDQRFPVKEKCEHGGKKKYSENDPRNPEQWTVGNVSRPYLHSNGREDGYCGFD